MEYQLVDHLYNSQQLITKKVDPGRGCEFPQEGNSNQKISFFLISKKNSKKNSKISSIELLCWETGEQCNEK